MYVVLGSSCCVLAGFFDSNGESYNNNNICQPLLGQRIESIDYLWQLISISDPSNCSAKRLLQGFDYLNTPFQPLYARNFTFLNCTSDALIFPSTGVSPIPCLSSESYSVVALPNDRYNGSNILSCSEIATLPIV
ncbi:putative RING-H2 finger protein ATL21A [Durio zibethinus]|uniref:RING-type E3 ubiquitin transferase n=1 Tax=Durio zibethinus TaxID=66656 RepID=A0A6P5ZNN5_DURZI|nr:putative RING-H2 finger protein ATL21A [Durio zibethinus]